MIKLHKVVIAIKVCSGERHSPILHPFVMLTCIGSTSGASSGIGAATALEFAKNGAKLVLAARNVERLNEVASQCSSHGLQQEKVHNNNCIGIRQEY